MIDAASALPPDDAATKTPPRTSATVNSKSTRTPATANPSLLPRPTADDPNDADLTYWYWGEDDAPGANGWLKKQVALYEKAHPNVKITVVTQSTDTLTSAFTTAAQTKSGPDIATQWATLPVLTPAWNGSSVPISDYVPAKEIKNWIGTSENMSGGIVRRWKPGPASSSESVPRLFGSASIGTSTVFMRLLPSSPT